MIKFILGDVIDKLKLISTESVDMSFADPPFNLSKSYLSNSDGLSDVEYMKWCKLWISELVRVTKPTGTIFIHNIPKWLIFYGEYLNTLATFKHWISWDARGSNTNSRLLPSHYGILFYTKSCIGSKFYPIRYNHKRCRKCNYLIKDYGGKKDSIHPFGPMVSDVWTDIHRNLHKKYRFNHPCNLPVPLLERLILMTTDENDLILDPFVGTGTTLVAAKNLGRQGIGIECEPEYIQIARDRIKECADSKIGNSWVSIYRKSVVTIRDLDWVYLKPHFTIPSNLKDLDFTTSKV